MNDAATVHILRKLISFDTTSAHSNLALLAWVQDYLRSHGVESQLIHNDDNTKANLYATLGPADKAGVMLSGHTDTVPVTGQNWTRPPHELSDEDGRFYGRGTADMKGFIAVALAAVPAMQAARLQTPIHLALSYDEEIGCVGVRRMIHMLAQQPVKPALCIIGEPTGLQVVNKHKGKLAARVTVQGKACHSGMAPQGVNAVNYAARLIGWLEQQAQLRQQQGPFEEGYDIPFSTVHTGTVQGGQALNIVPQHCSFLFEMRNIAAEDPHDLLAQLRTEAGNLEREMRRVDDSCRIDIDITTEYPGLSTAEDGEAITFVRQLTNQADAPLGNINFGTEGGLFSQALQVPTVVCGPGSMDQGHKPDEYIELSQLQQCQTFMQRLIERLSLQ
ncbi:acetylornithine deacetylase (ArgE) [Marinobacterium aestuarii]|uniref:Acetylornithine deacetylase (ArgE) n=2 Tax=Marinobacterium aestuarii TaxID=1821621 RepID=A0A1A9F5R7_9GAMM|nr:acetylornithine deacetylase (ArgE) [Marinobacterium aestuarii]